ncbi:acetyltransferase [Secundilactobacillus oryzae JCM 18671]|uniref:Acetyltransferase n=1 Tax=Secundilactobacillus oryzae JCM 18671 TaxID=1291743 RepID=A0A081BKM3_9LACO|nr:GNAT family N-acetyltransferase [Secundilactobacillus oryzae]GAK48591.1 acetyltransferase [Secundilactobacillus oryzae JCM 18671]
MQIRKAEMKDLQEIEKIVMDGRERLAEQGVDQWQGGYPNTEIIVDDIERRYTLVLEEDGEILGAAAVIPGQDASYQTIEGEWLTETDTLDTVAIHRVAVSSHHHGKGLGYKLLEGIYNEVANQMPEIKSLRIDTHPDNKGMQYVILKSGFEQTGMVKLLNMGLDDVYDYAYERLVKVPVKSTSK